MNPKEKLIFQNKVYTIEMLERAWQKSQPRLSGAEWLEVFPEAKSYLEYNLKRYRQEAKKLASEIQGDLMRIYKKKDEFTVWFLEKIVEIWKGEKLNWLDKEVRRLQWLLCPKKLKGKITEEQIQRAKEYPFKDLIETKGDFALCPFHSERKPSFYIKNNWGYCYGCGWHGDTIKFLMERDGLTFQEAIKYLT